MPPGQMISTVLILPDAQRAVGDAALGVAMKHANAGVSMFSVPLSASGAEPATHWGLHIWAPSSWVQGIYAARDDNRLPPQIKWSDAGLTEAQVLAMMDTMQISDKPDGEHEGNFDSFITSLGLQRIRSMEGPGR